MAHSFNISSHSVRPSSSRGFFRSDYVEEETGFSLCWHFRNDEEHARKMRESNMHLTECQKVVRSINIHNKMHKKAYVLLKGIREKHIYNNVQIHNKRETSQRRHRKIKQDKFEWKSGGQHYFFFLGYVMDWSAMFGLIYEGNLDSPELEPTFFHYFVVTIVFAGPLLFLQTFIGQYTRKGCLVLGEMLPLASGIGYTMLMLTFLRFAIQMYYTTVVLAYVFWCLVRPPWMFCYAAYEVFKVPCFSIKEYDLCPTLYNTTVPCFPPKTKVLSAVYFKDFIAFKRIEAKANNTMAYMSGKTFTLEFTLLHLAIITVLLLIISSKSIRTYELGLRLSLNFSFIAATTLLVVLFTQGAAVRGLQLRLFNMNFNSLLKIETWSAVFRRISVNLNLAEGGHYLFGAFNPPSRIVPYTSLTLIVLYTLLYSYFTWHYFLFEGLLVFNIGLLPKDLQIISEESIVFVTYPTVVGSQASARLFGFVYFLIMFLISLNSMALKLFVIEGTITMSYKLGDYYFYIRSFVVIISLLAIVPLSLEDKYERIQTILMDFRLMSLANVGSQFVVFIVYGIQTLWDDILFFYKVPVLSLVKHTWFAAPMMSVVTAYYEYMYLRKSDESTSVIVLFSFMLMIPIVICLIMEIVSYAKKKNLLGLLRPKFSFGQPDLQNRIYRLLYNPRLAVRYRRQTEKCNHLCLLNSPAVKVTIEDELELIRKLMSELDTSGKSERYNDANIKTAEILMRHQKLLKKYIENNL